MAERALRSGPRARKSRAQVLIHSRHPFRITRQRFQHQCIRMLFLPFTPARQQERVDLELGALERSRNGRRNRLLPAAAGFAIFENFIPADDAIGIEMESSSSGFGPKHEGRIAVPSPSDSDWAVRHLVLHHAVLRQIAAG